MTGAKEFSHIKSDRPSMVDVGTKAPTHRQAVAIAKIKLPDFVTDQLNRGEFYSKKGPVFHTASIAGVMAVKQTPSLIPLCHPVIIDDADVAITIEKPGLIRIECGVKCFGRTGVEMEALTGASIAALTIIDMCKSLTFDLTIIGVKVMKKTGGKHDREWDEE